MRTSRFHLIRRTPIRRVESVYRPEGKIFRLPSSDCLPGSALDGLRISGTLSGGRDDDRRPHDDRRNGHARNVYHDDRRRGRDRNVYHDGRPDGSKTRRNSRSKDRGLRSKDRSLRSKDRSLRSKDRSLRSRGLHSSKDSRRSNRYKRTRPQATRSSAEPPKSLSGQSFASSARSLSTWQKPPTYLNAEQAQKLCTLWFVFRRRPLLLPCRKMKRRVLMSDTS